MKKSFLFISMITIAIAACKKDDTPASGGTTPTAVSITASDFGNAGDTIFMNVDTTNLPNISFATGQNLTWDFSMLGVDRIDTIAFLDPSTTPGHNFFTTSNIAIQPEPNQPMYMYLNKSTDKVEGIGLWGNFQGTEIHAEYTDKPILMKFPMAYGSSFSDTSHLETTFNMNNQWIKLEMNQKIISQVDASGTIKLPNNVSFQCIREKRTEINKQIIYFGLSQSGPWNPMQTFTDTSYDYIFYAKNQKWEVANINVQDFTSNTIREIMYKK